MEHVLPRSRGGRTDDENLVVACRRCNKARRSRPVVAYLREVIGLGREPHLDSLRHALERMRSSARRRHREYGVNQSRLMERIA